MSKQTTITSKHIDEYIDRLPPWSKAICKKLRKILYKADPDITEVWKWSSPAFTHNRLVCIFWAFQKHVALIFTQGALIKDRYKLFNYGTGNKQNRSIKYTDVSQIRERETIAYIKEAVANSTTGKHIEIFQAINKTVTLPPNITQILKKAKLLEKYQQQIYTYRKGYLRWIDEAKQESTKKKRIRVMLRELKEGKEYMRMPR